MKNRIIFPKATLVFVGLATIGSNHTHIPEQKQCPSREFIENNYLIRTLHGLVSSNKKSEERKKILEGISRTRTRITEVHEQMQIENRASKLCNDCLQGIVEKTDRKLSRMQLQRAQELRVPVRYVNINILAKQKGVVIIDNFEI